MFVLTENIPLIFGTVISHCLWPTIKIALGEQWNAAHRQDRSQL